MDNQQEADEDTLVGDITMHVGGKEQLKLCGNGDIYVRGELCDNNKEIIQAAHDFFLVARLDITHCSKCGEIMHETKSMD